MSYILIRMVFEFFKFTAMEFSLNEKEIQWIQGTWKISEAWIGVSLKILSLTYVLLALSNGVFLNNEKFSEFSEFKESDKSLKHEFG